MNYIVADIGNTLTKIALVNKKETVIEALQRIANYFKNNHV